MWLLAIGLVASPALAGDDIKKDSADSTKTAATKPSGDSATAAAASSPATEAELQQMRDLLKAQADMLEQQRAALAKEAEKVRMLEERLGTAPTSAAPAGASATSAAPAVASGVTPGGVLAPVSTNTPATAAPLLQMGGSDKASPISFRIGNMDFTPGGFLDFTSVFRTTNVGSGIGTSFGAIPYNNTAAGGLTESRLSAQNSRITLKANGMFGSTAVTGYVEADFLGFQPANAYQTSNSNTLRMRVYWVQVRHDKFEFQAGQLWSFMTPNRVGLSPMTSDVFYTQDMDTNYQAGLTWARQAAVRFIVHPTNWWSLGVSLENPEQFVGGAVVFPASSFATQFDNGSGNTSSSGAVANTSVPNLFPDVIIKTAFDGKVGERKMHIEAAGLIREFKDFNALTSPSSRSSLIGGGGSVNVNLEIFKNFHAIANSYYSYGGGRYIFGLGPDVIVKPDGTLSGIHSGSGLGGFEWQVTPKALFYGYYSASYFQRNYGFLPSSATPAPSCDGVSGFTCVGFGFPGGSLSANRAIQETSFGYVPTLWSSPNYGSLKIITQYSYLTRSPWAIASGATGANPKDAHASMVYVDVRYTLP
jgi:hypothetical protein